MRTHPERLSNSTPSPTLNLMRPTRPSGTFDFGRVVRGGRARLSRRATVGAAVAALVAPLAVAAPTAGAVVNGTPSGPAPWAVQITTFSGIPGTPCSGVVVAPYWVATAKHCGPANPNAYTLGFGNQATVPGGFAETASLASPSIVGAFGSLDTGSVGRHTPVAAYHAPAGDVMLLKLAHRAPSPSVKRAGADPAPGATLRFHGFGETTPRGQRSAELRTGLTRLERVEPRAGSRIGRSHTTQGGYGNGDSGGPVFHGDLLVGIHSGSDHGRRQPNGTNPAWYESIPFQNGWIDWMVANR